MECTLTKWLMQLAEEQDQGSVLFHVLCGRLVTTQPVLDSNKKNSMNLIKVR